MKKITKLDFIIAQNREKIICVPKSKQTCYNYEKQKQKLNQTFYVKTQITCIKKSGAREHSYSGGRIKYDIAISTAYV